MHWFQALVLGLVQGLKPMDVLLGVVVVVLTGVKEVVGELVDMGLRNILEEEIQELILQV